ncbi:MAG: hypothetical protein K2K86_01460, partial [Muribaculaceae bacterium]|nr:hypothetical protein [Muribaculaceae bacterium]
MKIQKIKLAAILALGAASQAAVAAPTEYKIPSTQAEFETMWTTVAGEAGGSWEWVDDATLPYAQVTVNGTADNSPIGETLLLNEPISMKAGDVYYLQAKVTSDDYNNDVWFYIVYGTDKDNLITMPDDSYTFKCYYNKYGSDPWYIKPLESSGLRVLNITEDGDYYIGVRCKKSNKAAAKFRFASLYAEKSVNYPATVKNGEATTLTDVLGAELTWTWPTKNKNGDDIVGEIGANIYRSTSDSKADLYKAENLVGTVTGGKPGETGSFTDDPEHSLIPITEPGKYYYYVAPFNEEGENSEFASSGRITCKWVGEETQLLNIVQSTASATMIDEHSVQINYTPRIEPVNGGWFDESQAFLKVTRQQGNDEPVVLTETAPIVSPYIDNTLTEPGTYTYRLFVMYKGNESTECKLAAIYAGGTLPLPFNANFDNASDADMYTIFKSAYSYYWKFNSSNNCMAFNGYSWSGYNTTTMVTPPIKLEVGKTYRITCKSWVESTAKNLSIMVGGKAELAALKSIKDATIDQKNTNKQTVEGFFSPESTGIYYAGFYSES